MKQTKNEARMKKKKREWMAGAGLWVYLINLLIRIPLSRMIGDKGIGFFASGLEIFMVISVILSYSISKSVAVLIKYRVKRDMYKSARRVLKNAMVMAIAAGTAAGGGVFFFSEYIADVVVLEHMSYLAIAAFAPAVLLSAVIGVLRGYFQGMGTMIPSIHNKFLEKFIMIFASLILSMLLYSYGIKVAGLLKNEEYASAYGAMGAAFGVTIAAIFGILHLLFISFLYSGTFKQQLMKDNSKYTESNGQIIAMIVSTALPYALCGLLYNLNYLADQRLFNYAANNSGQAEIRLLHWGVYYGKYSVIIGAAAILCTIAGVCAIPKIAQFYDRHEFRDAHIKLSRTIHHMALVTIPCTILTAVLAEPLVGVLYEGEIKTAVSLVQAGTTVIALFAFSYLFAAILLRIRKIKIVMLGGLLSFVVHLIVVFVLLNSTKLGILSVAAGLIVFYLISCIVCFVSVAKYMQYTQEWIRAFGVTGVAAGVSGLIGLLLNKVLLPVAGNIVTLAVCVPVCIIVYIILIFVMKGVRDDELFDMPGGRVMIFIAERLHLM